MTRAMTRKKRVELVTQIIQVLLAYPWSPIASRELEDELGFGWDSRTWTRLLKQLEERGLVKHVRLSGTPILWYLPGEEPYVLERRQLTDEETETVRSNSMRSIQVLDIMRHL